MNRAALCTLFALAACGSGGDDLSSGAPTSQTAALVQSVAPCAGLRIADLAVVVETMRALLADPASTPGVTPSGENAFDFVLGVDLEGDGAMEGTVGGTIAFSAFPPTLGTTAEASFSIDAPDRSGSGDLMLTFGNGVVEVRGAGTLESDGCEVSFDISDTAPLLLDTLLAQFSVGESGVIEIDATVGGHTFRATARFVEGGISVTNATIDGQSIPDFFVPVPPLRVEGLVQAFACVAELIRAYAAIIVKAGEVVTADEPSDYASIQPDPTAPEDPFRYCFTATVSSGGVSGTLRGRVRAGSVDLYVPTDSGKPANDAFSGNGGDVRTLSLGTYSFSRESGRIIVRTGGGSLDVKSLSGRFECSATFSILTNTPDLELQAAGLHENDGPPRVTDIEGVMNRIGLTVWTIDSGGNRTELATLSGPVLFFAGGPQVAVDPISASFLGESIALGEFVISLDGS